MSGVLALLVAAPGCVGLPLTQQVSASGRRVVLLLDSSTSMRENDPEGVARLGADLVSGLVGSEDNLGAITYSASADVRLPMQRVGGATVRRQLTRALANVERSGITNFAAALDRAREMLDASQAPRGSPILLLTDGVPYRGRRREVGVSLGSVVGELTERGWPIYAIALTEQAQSPFLSLLVAKTGGAVFPVAKAENLLRAFEDVAVEALGYLRAERGGRQVRVAPETRRLAFVAHNAGGAGGKLEGIAQGGEPVPDDRWIRTDGAGYSVALVEAPEPGAWKAELEGDAEVVALLEPRFSLDFVAGYPPERVTSREEIELRVELLGDPQAMAAAGASLEVKAKLELNEKPRGRQFRLQRDARRAGGYVARFRAPVVSAEASLRVVVEAVLTTQGEPFVLQRTRSLTVQPGDGASELDVALSPSRVLASTWRGRPLPRVSFSVRGDPAQPVTVRCGDAKVELAAGATGNLSPTLTTPRLIFRAEGLDGSPWAQGVPVRVRQHALDGRHRRGVRLPQTPAGLASESVALDLRSVPAAELSFSGGPLRGPGGIELPLVLKDGRASVQPDATLPPGTYKGRLRVTARGVDGATEVPIGLEVLAPFQAPGAITVEGSWGWTTTPVELAWPTEEAVPVRILARELIHAGGARIRPGLDIRLRPLDGWRGDRLGVSPQRLAFEVYVSSDLPAGDYSGSLSIEARGGGRDPLVIPVRLGVRR